MNLVSKKPPLGIVIDFLDSKLILENNIIRRKTWSHYKRSFIMRTLEEALFQISSFKDRHMFTPQAPDLLFEHQKKIHYLTSLEDHTQT